MSFAYSLHEMKDAPLARQGPKHGEAVLIFACDVRVQERKEMRQKRGKCDWMRICGLCGEMPLFGREVENNTQVGCLVHLCGSESHQDTSLRKQMLSVNTRDVD